METMKSILKHETRRQRAYHFGKYVVFAPELLTKSFGDGKQLIYFGTIDQRPRYWLVRVDSKANIEEGFESDEILEAIIEEFGDGNSEEPLPYPAIKSNLGTYWGLVKNFAVKPKSKLSVKLKQIWLIKNTSKGLWFVSDAAGTVKHSRKPEKSTIFYDEEEVDAVCEGLDSKETSCYTVIPAYLVDAKKPIIKFGLAA